MVQRSYCKLQVALHNLSWWGHQAQQTGATCTWLQCRRLCLQATSTLWNLQCHSSSTHMQLEIHLASHVRIMLQPSTSQARQQTTILTCSNNHLNACWHWNKERLGFERFLQVKLCDTTGLLVPYRSRRTNDEFPRTFKQKVNPQHANSIHSHAQVAAQSLHFPCMKMIECILKLGLNRCATKPLQAASQQHLSHPKSTTPHLHQTAFGSQTVTSMFYMSRYYCWATYYLSNSKMPRVHLIWRSIRWSQTSHTVNPSRHIDLWRPLSRSMSSPLSLQSCTPPVLIHTTHDYNTKTISMQQPEDPAWDSQYWQIRLDWKPVTNRWHFP